MDDASCPGRTAADLVDATGRLASPDAANLIAAATTSGSLNGATSEPGASVPPLYPGATVLLHRMPRPCRGTVFHHFIGSGLTAGAPYCASFWVWVPAGFGGKLVAASINGFPALGGRAADLAVRDTWQRIWCAATVAEGYNCADPSLVVAAEAGDAVYSTCWQFESGAAPTGWIPTGGAAPALKPHPIRVLPLDALTNRLGPVAADGTTGVRRVDRLTPPGLYRRPRPAALDSTDLDPGQRATLDEISRACDQPYDAVRCVRLRDALIAGQGSVVTRDGTLVRDSAAEFLAQGMTPDGFTAAADGTLRLPPPCRRIGPPVLLLKRPWWRNYGHWLIDSAAALGLATRLCPPPTWQLVVGRQESPKMRQVVADSLACLAPGVPVLEHPDNEVWACDELIYFSPLHIPPLFKHPEGLAVLRAQLLRAAPAGGRPARRLFVSRGDHPARRLDNEAELIAIASRHGYEVVEPQRLDLAGQAQLFHAAASVVGVKGAALANLLFCPAGTPCLVLSPGDFPDPFFWDLASHAGVIYAELFGRVTSCDRPQSHNSFRIDPARFAELLPV